MSKNLFIVGSICLIGLIHPEHVQGSPPTTCRRDAECSPDSYCLDGYCEPCIPCHNFGRQRPFIAGTCAKKEEECGPCMAGYKTEEHIGMRHSFRCKKSDEITAPPFQPPNFFETSNLSAILIAISVLAFVAFTVTLYLKRWKVPAVFTRLRWFGSSLPTSENPIEVVEYKPPDPAYNPYCQDDDETAQTSTYHTTVNEERLMEHENNVEALPFIAPSSGLYEGVVINLEDYRDHTNQSDQSELLSIAPSTPLSTLDDGAVSVDIDPDAAQNQSGDCNEEAQNEKIFFSFFVSLKRIITKPARRANNTSAILVADNE